MTVLKDTLLSIILLSTLGITGIAGSLTCEDTRFTFSKCYENDRYLWVIEVPKSQTACEGKDITPPRSAPCNLACDPGKALNTENLECKKCSAGQFSLGGGQQFIFDETKSLESMNDLTVDAKILLGYRNEKCDKNNVWRIKGSILQGDVITNCALEVKLRFKLIRPGSVTVNYNLPTSTAIGTITSRCDFDLQMDNDDSDGSDSDDDGLRRRFSIHFPSTGYGVWEDKKINIREAGEYVLTIFTMSLNSFHFPFSIRSIVVEGNTYIQECTPCPPGTYSSSSGSRNCTSCPMDSIAPDSGSTRCRKCDPNEYADDSSTKCLQRPRCELKDFQRKLKRCDKNQAIFEYTPIQPKICMGEVKFPTSASVPCGICNPGMFKNPMTKACDFCPSKTYSDGTSESCKSCSSDLSLVTGLYYKFWEDLPKFFNRSYMSFDQADAYESLLDADSWIPSVTYISSQAVPDTLSMLSLSVIKGFSETSVAKLSRNYGTLTFKFSVQCQARCELILVSEEIYNDERDDWIIINKWYFNETQTHQKIIEYTYTIPKVVPVVFSWLFTADTDIRTNDEIRIYEINVTNTKVGGSDRCVTCYTQNNEQTECQACSSGFILLNRTCTRCPPSTVAARLRSTDLVPNVCQPCPNNTISDDGVSCFVPCLQKFGGNSQYNLDQTSVMEFHGSKLFTQTGSGYFHLFNVTICGKTSATCQRISESKEKRRSSKPTKVESLLCRMGAVLNENGSIDTIAYVDDFGEELVNISLFTSKYFPPLRSDYDLTDITLTYRANISNSQSTCASRVTFLSLRCDHNVDKGNSNSSSINYRLQTPNDCVTGTCDGCTFHFLLRSPSFCPICEENETGYRIFHGPCKFGRQEIRKIPHQYCTEKLKEKVEFQRCSMFSVEIQILIAVFILIAIGLASLVVVCWRKNRKLEYRYMQLIENTNPDDDTPADNVCAQISDEEDSGEEVQFKKTSRTKKIIDAVRYAIRKNPNNDRSDNFARDSFLLNGQSNNDA